MGGGRALRRVFPRLLPWSDAMCYRASLPWVPRIDRLPLADQHALFTRIVTRCRPAAGAPVPVVVFDLDGTLMDNRPRTAIILQRARLRAPAGSALRRGGPRRNQCRASCLPGDRLASSASASSTPSSSSRAETYWKARFFTDDYLKHDMAVAGSVELARACYDAGATIVYFTGRDLPLDEPRLVPEPARSRVPDRRGRHASSSASRKRGSRTKRSNERKHRESRASVRSSPRSTTSPATATRSSTICPDADVVFVDTQHLPGAPPLSDRVHIVGDLTMR